ncbi:MAG: hypothetical protein IJM14_09230 [Lachnospiraceae bacterium]|nr:hypothetical protein [Lachnospiraceae bacterium]
MKNKRLRNRIIAIIAAMALIVLAAIPALAAGGLTNENTYNPTSGTSGAGFDKYLIIEENDIIPPTAVFNFEVTAPIDDIDATSNSLQVFSGPDPQKVKLYVAEDGVDGSSGSYNISFSGASADVSFGDSGAENLEGFESGTKYAKKSVVIDFTDVAFEKPGVYRYYITENPTTGFGIKHGEYKTIDVYVSDTDPSGTTSGSVYDLVVDGYVMYDGNITEAPGNNDPASRPSGATKDDIVVNKYPSVDLTVMKKVSGNQASKSDFFSFTLEISNGTPNAKLTLDISNMVINDDHNNGISTTAPQIALDADGNGSLTFELQHGQSIRVFGLAEGSFYSVKENDTEGKLSKAGYTTVITQSVTDASEQGEIDDTERIIVLNSGTGSGKGMKKANEITFTNTKEGKIPTGVNMKVVPIVVIALLFIGGISVLTVRMAKKEENEEV